MSRSQSIFILLIVCLSLVMFIVGNLPVMVLLEAGPWWVYFVMTGILLSGYLAYSSMLEDKKVDERVIEKEGQLYIERMKARKNETDK